MIDIDLNRIIVSAVKSGKVFFGSKQAIAASKVSRAVALIVASNCPNKILADIQRYSGSSKVPLFVYPAPSSDLGVACGKHFSVSVLTIREINEPEVLKMVQESAKVNEGQSK